MTPFATARRMIGRNALVREAIGRIKPLRGSDGPNHFTVRIEHGHLSAPTRPLLARWLWHYFDPSREEWA